MDNQLQKAETELQVAYDERKAARRAADAAREAAREVARRLDAARRFKPEVVPAFVKKLAAAQAAVEQAEEAVAQAEEAVRRAENALVKAEEQAAYDAYKARQQQKDEGPSLAELLAAVKATLPASEPAPAAEPATAEQPAGSAAAQQPAESASAAEPAANTGTAPAPAATEPVSATEPAAAAQPVTPAEPAPAAEPAAEAAPETNAAEEAAKPMPETVLVNLTPHAINIFAAASVQPHPTVKGDFAPVEGVAPALTVAPSGTVARVSSTSEPRAPLTVAGVEVATTTTTFGPVEGLPDPEAGKVFIVSGLVLSRVETRPDVVAPGKAVRDADGKIVGCVGLSVTPAFPSETPVPTPSEPPVPSAPATPAPAVGATRAVYYEHGLEWGYCLVAIDLDSPDARERVRANYLTLTRESCDVVDALPDLGVGYWVSEEGDLLFGIKDDPEAPVVVANRTLLSRRPVKLSKDTPPAISAGGNKGEL